MIKTFAPAVALLLIAFTLSPPRAQQQTTQKPRADDDDVIRVETALVTVPVAVRDRKGRLVRGLQREDFRLYEDGVEQELAYFEPPTPEGDVRADTATRPLTVALLLDVSDSTEHQLEQIRAAALAFVNLLRPGDRVTVVAFDQRVNVLAEATNDRAVLREAISRARTGGGTSLYAALDSVIRQSLARVVGRKAVVLLTDGVDTTSAGVKSEDALRAAEESDTAIYPIQYNTYADSDADASGEAKATDGFGTMTRVTKNGVPLGEAYKRATTYLQLLADKTGGRFQESDGIKRLARSFESVAAQLREQYALGYYPKNRADGTERQIKIEVAAPGVNVRARKGYTYKKR